MPDLQALLDQIQQIERHTRPGPWAPHPIKDSQMYAAFVAGPEADTLEPEIAAVVSGFDAEFIALARTALPQLAKALRAVMEIHKPFHADHYYNGMDGESLHRFVPRCDGCEESGGIEDYPCPTVRAITDAMKGDE